MTKTSFHPSPGKANDARLDSKEAKAMRQLRVQEEVLSRPNPGMQSLVPLEQPVAPRVRYIGSKARIAEAIVLLFGKPIGRLVDACSGTGIVARTAAERGWAVHINDHLTCATTMSLAQLCSRGEARMHNLGGYEAAVARLNQLGPTQGFVHAEYAPTGRSRSGDERRYFTPGNAGRIDSIRLQIRDWAQEGTVNPIEAGLLTADLMSAANAVANISGTYGCFLKQFQTNALQPLRMRCRPLREKPVQVQVTNQDLLALDVSEDSTSYIDPPYTKRQYAAYYHILETIAVGDEPVVGGKTGLRPWQDKDSPFCHKRRAGQAFRDAVERLQSRRILISYSDDAHLSRDELRQAVGEHGRVKVHELGNIGRYRPNAVANQQETVGEYVLELVK